MHKWAAVKSSLGAQTVLGDRHDPIYENFVASEVGRLRNSPERTFQRLETQTEARRNQPRNYSHGNSRANADRFVFAPLERVLSDFAS